MIKSKKQNITGKKRRFDKENGPDKKKTKQTSGDVPQTEPTFPAIYQIADLAKAIKDGTPDKITFKRVGDGVKVYLNGESPFIIKVGGPTCTLSSKYGWGSKWTNQRGMFPLNTSVKKDFNPDMFTVFNHFDDEIAKWGFDIQLNDRGFFKGAPRIKKLDIFKFTRIRPCIKPKEYVEKVSLDDKIAYNFQVKVFTDEKGCVYDGIGPIPPTQVREFTEGAKSTTDCKPLVLEDFRDYSTKHPKVDGMYHGFFYFATIRISNATIGGLRDKKDLGIVCTAPNVFIVPWELKNKLSGDSYNYEKEKETAVQPKDHMITFQSPVKNLKI